MSIALGVLALLVALASVGYARRSVRQATRSADAAEASAVHARRSADAAEAAIHDQHAPRLKVWLDGLGPEADIPRAFYTVRNDGPQDLDAVTVYRPRPSGTVGYWVGPPGLATAGEQVSLGALALGGQALFTLFYVYRTGELPEFAVPIECRKDKERWQLLEVLPPPPQSAPPQDWGQVYRPE